MLTTEDALRCLAHAFPHEDPARITISEHDYGGAINVVRRAVVGDRAFALRVRVNDNIFRYEKNVIKDAMVGQFLTRAAHRPGENNESLLSDIAAGAAGQASGGRIVSPLSPDLVHFDQSRTIVPYCWSVHAWLEGPLLDQSEDRRYYSDLGGLLATLHRSRFENFLPTLTSEWQDAIGWLRSAMAEISSVRAKYGIDTTAVSEICQAAEAQAENLGFVLCHNDVQPLNIIVHGSRPFLIDWDNCQVAPPEMDFVKLKYWTRRDRSGNLGSSDNDHRAVVDGYVAHGGGTLNQTILRFCELLWLLRVFSFETDREATRRKAAPPFPAASHYADLLRRHLATAQHAAATS